METSTKSKAGNLFDKAERIGVIGSPSSTGELNIDILDAASAKNLVGCLAVFRYNQDNVDNYALSQITEVTMENVWTQDPTMKGIIRRKGRVDPITGRQDTHIATMTVSSVLADVDGKLEPSSFGTVPPTGTYVKFIDAELMDALIEARKQELFYLGTIYGSEIKLPMWFKHFGNHGDQMGLGEAYHIGIFGKTGSGKSVLAKMVMMAYARHKAMSLFVLDPQGEFSSDFGKHGLLGSVLDSNLHRDTTVVHLQDLVLEYSNELFEKLLIVSGFFDSIKIAFEKHYSRFFSEMMKYIHSLRVYDIDPSQDLERKRKITTELYHSSKVFRHIWEHVRTDDFVTKVAFTDEPKNRIKKALEDASFPDVYKHWKSVTYLFTKGRGNGRDSRAISELFNLGKKEGSFVIIDLSLKEKPRDLFWNERIKYIATQEILKTITNNAETTYKEGNSLNTLVILDEAHRFVPKIVPEDDEVAKIRTLLIDGIRTTRKFGLGWMFISQSLSSLDREIINQMRVYFFGFGLAWGIERAALRELIGGAEKSLNLYQAFKDPQSGLTSREYPFMSIGP
nr:ATP-binding protein [Candidatus Sigynarchaeota archaeon]